MRNVQLLLARRGEGLLRHPLYQPPQELPQLLLVLSILEVGHSIWMVGRLGARKLIRSAMVRASHPFSRSRYFFRNFATFGSITARQYGWVGCLRKYSSWYVSAG